MSSRQTAVAMAEVAPRTRMRLGRVLDIRGDSLPEGGRESRVDKAGELLPLRIKRLELLRSHHGVFCRVHGAAVFERDVAESSEQVEALFARWEVEGERDAWARKGEHAGRPAAAEDLDDSQERCEPRGGDF